MRQTTIGKHRCELGKRNDRPFVVEWDATDLASFEAKTRRDVVIVKVSGCDVKVLDCRDDGVPGSYGTYGPPEWTTGAVEGFDIRSEADLYARLPLGAASLTANLRSGKSLHLTYFVSGTTEAVRDAVYRGDIEDNPLCANATHFVSAYDLGAFEITATDQDREEVGAGVAGVGAGASITNESKRLRRAGVLSNCTGDAARDLARCKIPIRIALRPIADGQAPVTATSSKTRDELGKRDELAALFESAQTKFAAKDGRSCLTDLDRARGLNGAEDGKPKRQELRAQCEMLAGHCEDGRKRLRNATALINPSITPEQLDTGISERASALCAPDELSPFERAHRASQRIRAAQRETAEDRAIVCKEEGRALAKQLQRLPDESRGTRKWAFFLSVLRDTSECLGRVRECPEARRLWEAAERERTRRDGGGPREFVCTSDSGKVTLSERDERTEAEEFAVCANACKCHLVKPKGIECMREINKCAAQCQKQHCTAGNPQCRR